MPVGKIIYIYIYDMMYAHIKCICIMVRIFPTSLNIVSPPDIKPEQYSQRIEICITIHSLYCKAPYRLHHMYDAQGRIADQAINIHVMLVYRTTHGKVVKRKSLNSLRYSDTKWHQCVQFLRHPPKIRLHTSGISCLISPANTKFRKLVLLRPTEKYSETSL